MSSQGVMSSEFTDIKQRSVYTLIQFTLILFFFSQVGGTYMKPLILPSQVAIGALGKIQVMSL